MENAAIALDSTVRSQDSSNSKDSKGSKDSSASDSKPESCLESKHSKEILISEKQQRQQQPRTQQHPDDRQKLKSTESKDESNLLMFTSCGQLLLGKFLFNIPVRGQFSSFRFCSFRYRTLFVNCYSMSVNDKIANDTLES